MPVPQPTRIFHITAIPNLHSICSAGSLLALNLVSNEQIAYQNIAYQTVQSRRSVKVISVGPQGMLHDYVPFYFAPRSPMLYTINLGNVPNCPYRQDDIVHIEMTLQDLVGGGEQFVFFDMNAALAISTPYSDLRDLDKIAWDLICESPTLDGYCKYFRSNTANHRYALRMEKRQAEFLVHRTVSIDYVRKIGVSNGAKKLQVEQILRQHNKNISVEVRQDWYF
jgi:hypothetical protein